MKKKTKAIIISSSIISFLLLSYFLGGYLAGLGVTHALFDHRQSNASDLNSKPYYLSQKTREDYPSLSNRRDFSFVSLGNSLKAHLYEVSDPKGTLIFVHGLSSLGDGESSSMQDYFLSKGYDIITFDLTGHGESQGEGIGGLYQASYDVAALIDAIFEENTFYIPTSYVGIIGHSMGAYGAVSSLSLTSHSINAVTAFSAFAIPEEEMVEMAVTKAGPIANLTALPFSWSMQTRDKGKSKVDASKIIDEHTETSFVLVQGEEDQTVSKKARLSERTFSNKKVSKINLPEIAHDSPWKKKEALLVSKQAQEKYYQLPEENRLEAYKAYLEENDIKNLSSSLNEDLLETISTKMGL